MTPDDPFGPPIQRPAAEPIRIAKPEEEPEAAGPSVELVWPDGAPGALGDKVTDKPTIDVYSLKKEQLNGTSVVLCPGGGYDHLALDHEGDAVAKWLSSLGITAFLLKYRVAPHYRQPAPLQDARRAVRMVRYRAQDWLVDPHRIGVMGFSAGGHLASITATRWNEGNKGADDPIDRVGSRPDFAILIYPVISFTTRYANQHALDNLLGGEPTDKLLNMLSSDRHVNTGTPPTFMVHAGDDKAVPPENSVIFYLALRRAGVPCELHIYERGGHGFGLAPDDPILASWPRRCADWLRRRGLLDKPQ